MEAKKLTFRMKLEKKTELFVVLMRKHVSLQDLMEAVSDKVIEYGNGQLKGSDKKAFESIFERAKTIHSERLR